MSLFVVKPETRILHNIDLITWLIRLLITIIFIDFYLNNIIILNMYLYIVHTLASEL